MSTIKIFFFKYRKNIGKIYISLPASLPSGLKNKEKLEMRGKA